MVAKSDFNTDMKIEEVIIKSILMTKKYSTRKSYQMILYLVDGIWKSVEAAIIGYLSFC